MNFIIYIDNKNYVTKLSFKADVASSRLCFGCPALIYPQPITWLACPFTLYRVVNSLLQL